MDTNNDSDLNYDLYWTTDLGRLHIGVFAAKDFDAYSKTIEAAARSIVGHVGRLEWEQDGSPVDALPAATVFTAACNRIVAALAAHAVDAKTAPIDRSRNPRQSVLDLTAIIWRDFPSASANEIARAVWVRLTDDGRLGDKPGAVTLGECRTAARRLVIAAEHGQAMP